MTRGDCEHNLLFVAVRPETDRWITDQAQARKTHRGAVVDELVRRAQTGTKSVRGSCRAKGGAANVSG